MPNHYIQTIKEYFLILEKKKMFIPNNFNIIQAM